MKSNKYIGHDFKGVWIPKEVWFDKNLTWMEKLFFIEIYHLDNGQGCYASNKFFSELLQLSNGRCSQIINTLKNKNYIKIRYEKNGKEIKKRIINIEEGGIKYIKGGVFNILKGGIKNTKGGYLENDEENNIYNNIYNKNINNSDIPNKPKLTQKQKNILKKYKTLSSNLANIIQKHKKINNKSNVSNWVKPIRLLIEKDLNVDGTKIKDRVKRVQSALDWYEENAYKDKYTVVIESGEALREKFTKLENAINREKESKPKGNYEGAFDNNHHYKNMPVREVE